MAIKDLPKVQIATPIDLEIASLESVVTALSIPSEEERQPDLQYLTAIFVSSGMNKNGAVFLGSELVKSKGSINNKAVDVEHDEQKVVGQITGNVFMDREHRPIDLDSLLSETASEDLDLMDLDIAIGAIIHKSRFPELAEEILENKWMVSMEAYYRNYDIKVGENIIPREEAEALGYDKLVGSVVRVRNGKKELGFHLVGRVLRDIIFAGVGLVKNPANPRSIIMEAAALTDYVKSNSNNYKTTIDLAEVSSTTDINSPSFNITKEFIKNSVEEAIDSAISKYREKANLPLSDRPAGTCVHYKKYVYNTPGPEDDNLPEPETDLTQYPLFHRPVGGDDVGPGSEVIREHYCNLFDLDCTARPGDASKPDCWRNVFARTMRDEIVTFEQVLRNRRVSEGLQSLQDLLDEVRKYES